MEAGNVSQLYFTIDICQESLQLLFQCASCQILQYYQNQRVFISNLECIFCGNIVLLPNENSLPKDINKKPNEEEKVFFKLSFTLQLCSQKSDRNQNFERFTPPKSEKSHLDDLLDRNSMDDIPSVKQIRKQSSPKLESFDEVIAPPSPELELYENGFVPLEGGKVVLLPPPSPFRD